MSQFPESHVYKLKWNSHVQSLQDVFQELLQKETFTDVTLSFQDGTLKAHKAMLSSCSSYFAKIFKECERKHSVIVMCGVTKPEMASILKFVYSGEISLSEEEIQGVLNSAKLLEIRGLSDTAKEPESPQAESLVGLKASSPIGCDPALAVAASLSRKSSTPRPRKRPAPVTLVQTGPQSLVGGGDANISPSDASAGLEASQKKTFRKPAPSPIKRMRPNDSTNDLSMMEESIDSGKDEGSPFYPEVSLSDAPESDGPQLESPLRVRKDLLGDSDLGTSVSPSSIDAIERSSSATTLSTLDEDVKREVGENYPFNVLDESGMGNGVSAICPFCLKDCKRTAELRAHIRAHTGEKPFQCDICGAPFARSAHLKRHRRVHTGERPFECPRCGKTFSRQDKLKLHVDRHTFKEGGCVPIPKAEREAMAALKVKEEGGVKKYSKKSKEQATVPGINAESPVAPQKQELPIQPAPSNGISVPSAPFGDVSYLSLLSVPPRQLINADFSAAFIRSAVHEQALRQLFQSATQQPRDLSVPSRPTMLMNRPRPGLPTSTEGLVSYVQNLGECTIRSVDGSN